MSKSLHVKTYNEAEITKRANDLAKRVKKVLGGDWTIRVWKNLGWSCSVHSDNICIAIDDWSSEARRCHRTGYCGRYKYSCYIGGKAGTESSGQWVGDGNTIPVAYQNAMKEFNKYAEEISACYNETKKLKRDLTKV